MKQMYYDNHMARLPIAVIKSLPSITSAYFNWILKCSKNPRKTPMSIKYKKLKSLLTVINKNLKIELIVEGQKNSETDIPCLFVPNHLSAYDPFPIFATTKNPTTVVSKVENKKLPIVGRIISAIEGLFLIRNDLKDSINVMKTVEADLSEKNKNWIIFPEGTRNRDIDADLLEFHKGAFRAAMRAKAPIVPVALYGTFCALSTKYNLRKYPIYVSYMKPFYADDYKDMSADDLCGKCKEMIQKETNRLRKEFNKTINSPLYRKSKVSNS